MSSTGNRSGTRPQDEGALQDSISAAAEAASDMLERGRETVGSMVERGRESAERVRENLSDRVRERPLTSVLVAGGVGLLLGMLVARRRGE